jgi:DNA-3-methyladenine glycosylase II
MFAKAIKHLQKDLVLKPIIKACKKEVEQRFDRIEEQKDVYLILLKSIVSQQLSTKAANTIYSRFEALFNTSYPKPKEVLRLSNETLRSVGLSGQKCSYIKALAEYALEYDMSYEHISTLSNEDLIEQLTSIKGVGQWTVEMMLIFSLKRLDVFPYDDLVVRNQMIKLYNLQGKGKQLKQECFAIAQDWHPYGSIASLFLWQSKHLV